MVSHFDDFLCRSWAIIIMRSLSNKRDMARSKAPFEKLRCLGIFCEDTRREMVRFGFKPH